MSRYTTHRHFVFSCTIHFYILLNISPPNDRRKMKHSSLDSSWRNESNGGSFVFLGAIDVELYHTSALCIFVHYMSIHFYILLNISSSNDRRKMEHSLLDLSWWDESNGGSFVFLGGIDVELDYTLAFIFSCTIHFYISLNISPSIASRDAKLPPFNSSHWDESNELCFISLWSLDGEINDKMYFFNFINEFLKKILNWKNFY
jgi:hypothetical protein